MSPRRKSPFRQTRLQFKKPDPKQPSSLPSQTPLKPLPRPTAPPVFQKTAPKKKHRVRNSAFDDDYWEMAQRIMDGQAVNPGNNVVEEDAPVIDVDASNSDDDFEPPSVVSHVARQRPQLLTPTSRMRNDRSSMTKSSANRGKKTKKPIRFSTSSQKRNSEVGVKSKQLTIPALESSSSEEELDHVIFEGEKSELSETDEDEPIIRPPDKECFKRSADRRNSSTSVRSGNRKLDMGIAFGEVDAGGQAKSPVSKKCEESDSKVLNVQEPINDFCKSKPDILLQISGQCPKANSLPKRACDLPRLFSDDSDDSIGIKIPRSSRLKKARRMRRIEESSEDEDPHEVERSVNTNVTHLDTKVAQSCGTPEEAVPPAHALKNNIHSDQDSELSTCEIEGQNEATLPKRKRLNQAHCLSGEAYQSPSIALVHSDQRFTKSLLRGKTRRRLSFAASQDTGITPPSTPSPPSTRKRRLRSKLITISSEEEEEPCGDPDKQLELPNGQQKSTEFKRIPEETEWYHEREIDAFSSSAEDYKGSSPAKVITARSKKRVSATKPGALSGRHNKPSPVLMDPVMEASADFMDQVRFKKQNVSRVEPPHEVRNADRADNEVIDLVDDDEFDDFGPSNTQKDVIVSSKDDIFGSDMENAKEAPTDYVDNSLPPPFNLYILCNEGESIADMRTRLGENALMDKVIKARNDGREIIGGNELGLRSTFNKDVFSRFSKTVVGDQVSRRKASTSITEKALRGEYSFNYRGKDRDQRRRGNSSRGRGSTQATRGRSYRNRLSTLGHRRR
eukprot:TRINITY_DN1057_c0_g1_i1.p1 TRINITY_DN1057_c0_g1~~TRINITY_DN1057_c0_g1_i1.p1  ORF type:complete len:790 (-),score=122.79 TRINITY_DN1057_c0_g1_i1:618-2987(-)